MIVFVVLAAIVGVVLGWILGSSGSLSDVIWFKSSTTHQIDDAQVPELEARIASLQAELAVGAVGTQQVHLDQYGAYEAEIFAMRARVHELEAKVIASGESISELQTDLLDLHGMTADDQSKLVRLAGIQSQAELIALAKSSRGRTKITEDTGISDTTILRWANLVDYQRLRGLTARMAYFLVSAGFDSLAELAKKRPEVVLTKLKQVMESNGAAAETPTEQTIHAWVEEAKTFPRIIAK